MAELFSDEWMKDYMAKWNGEPELAEALARIGFNSNIGYGLLDEDQPRGILVVENGKVTSAGAYTNESMNWDLRASEDNWNKWMDKGLGMMSLGAAYMSGKLKFKTGDYTAMVKDPRMAGPFIKTFTVMGTVGK